jgi:hypothetical protein
MRHNCFPPLAADPQVIFSTTTRVPSESLITEVYVHRDLVERGFVYRPLVTDALFRAPEDGPAGQRLDVAALGGAFTSIEPTADIDSPVKAPRYRELIKFTMDRIGQSRQDFWCFRLRLPMAPLGIMAALLAGNDPEPAPEIDGE